MKKEYEFSSEQIEEGLRVDAVYRSGAISSVFIQDVDSPNPAMRIPNPVKFDALLTILNECKQEFRGAEFSIAFGRVDGKIRVDIAVGCGNRFEGIAWIVDEYVPLLQVPKPLGLNAIATIVEQWMERGSSIT